MPRKPHFNPCAKPQPSEISFSSQEDSQPHLVQPIGFLKPKSRFERLLNRWDQFAVEHPIISMPAVPLKNKIDERSVMNPPRPY